MWIHNDSNRISKSKESIRLKDEMQTTRRRRAYSNERRMSSPKLDHAARAIGNNQGLIK